MHGATIKVTFVLYVLGMAKGEDVLVRVHNSWY